MTLAETLLANVPLVRMGIFLSVFMALAAIEFVLPFREAIADRARRWPANLGILVVDILVARIVLPMGAVGVAVIAEVNGWGLFNALDWPVWLEAVIAILLLDLVIYWQHVAFHKVPVLWRLHRVHHADTAFDVTTGLRFHPVEIALSLFLKGAVTIALGASPIAVLIFEVILNACAMFSHANLRLPPAVDRFVRLFVVTPGMHRVHHSAERVDTDSNYGFNVPWWDRLFGTYRPEPVPGDDKVVFGIEAFRDNAEQRLDKLVTMPFREPAETKRGP